MTPPVEMSSTSENSLFAANCPQCYYDLSNLPDKRCPECGTVVAESEIILVREHKNLLERWPWQKLLPEAAMTVPGMMVAGSLMYLLYLPTTTANFYFVLLTGTLIILSWASALWSHYRPFSFLHLTKERFRYRPAPLLAPLGKWSTQYLWNFRRDGELTRIRCLRRGNRIFRNWLFDLSFPLTDQQFDALVRQIRHWGGSESIIKINGTIWKDS